MKIINCFRNKSLSSIIQTRLYIPPPVEQIDWVPIYGGFLTKPCLGELVCSLKLASLMLMCFPSSRANSHLVQLYLYYSCVLQPFRVTTSLVVLFRTTCAEPHFFHFEPQISGFYSRRYVERLPIKSAASHLVNFRRCISAHAYQNLSNFFYVRQYNVRVY